jgi:hypothetical protein
MKYVHVVGIDPSLSAWGFSHLAYNVEAQKLEPIGYDLELVKTENEVTKQTRKNSDDLRRARELQAAMIRNCQHAAIACVEVPVGSQSARAMASYGVCVGILASCPIPMIQVSPTEVKQESGYKFATKEEMIAWASSLYPNLNWLRKGGKLIAANEHLADSIGAIHAGVRTQEFRAAIAMLSSISR